MKVDTNASSLLYSRVASSCYHHEQKNEHLLEWDLGTEHRFILNNVPLHCWDCRGFISDELQPNSFNPWPKGQVVIVRPGLAATG